MAATKTKIVTITASIARILFSPRKKQNQTKKKKEEEPQVDHISIHFLRIPYSVLTTNITVQWFHGLVV